MVPSLLTPRWHRSGTASNPSLLYRTIHLQARLPPPHHIFTRIHWSCRPFLVRDENRVQSVKNQSHERGGQSVKPPPAPPASRIPPFSALVPFLPQVLHIQNPGKMRGFHDVAGWLEEATGAQLTGVSMDEFKTRLSKAVEEKGPQDVGVLAQV